MEATPGFEPGNRGFADPCLTTWLRRRQQKLERKTGFEPATLALARRCSTTELLPRRALSIAGGAAAVKRVPGLTQSRTERYGRTPGRRRAGVFAAAVVSQDHDTHSRRAAPPAHGARDGAPRRHSSGRGPRGAHAWDRLLARHHYLGRSRLVGAALRYVAVVDGEPVALVGFASGPRVDPVSSQSRRPAPRPSAPAYDAVMAQREHLAAPSANGPRV